ncbi:S-adenosyl-L-methionine-dependent methyltransferase [Fusarium flagelliforme]|uniref:Methyltransferase n=1 Tax=Fusarium flagelliforme TaxID=2675880 RepID=A0A395MAX2_9HYPO|nr:S-adenosyl-L-methionine-dependent methyltransferase [Fusarium flagelliforme]KAH7183677.1 S-adenosyl-L-methionine-dependent methyltransferase [Fusarium flagelliforme]RFN45011.1 hypothetical protein FIE12Z_10739 [Fusarium flagelliforme]
MVATPHEETIVADDNVASSVIDDDDSALGGDAFSDSTSLKSSILKYREENGRTYHAYKDGAYALPNDEVENERLDLQHHLMLLTFDGKLHAAPLPEKLDRVFDVGCGTGIWSIEFADEHPETQVIGADLSPIQPSAVPPNVTFYVDDVEESWDYSAKFDFIFARFLTGSIRDWPKFFRQSYENINAGGVIELIDCIYPMASDDDTLSKDSALYKWSKMLLDAFTDMGSGLDSVLRYQEQLEEAGFVNVEVVKRKWPLNAWPKDPKYKQLGIWSFENGMNGLSGASLAAFTRPKSAGGLGWSAGEVELFLADVRKDLRNLKIHAYCHIWSVYATKPEQ